MKTLFKRGLPFLLTLALLVSLLSGLTFNVSAATVDYVYSGNYVYNWGEREELATFLSPMAEDWYTAQGTSYAELSALSGSSSTSSVPSSALYNTLQDLMVGAHSNKTSYDGTKELYRYTDCENSGGTISSFYSGKAIGPSWDGAWNREHTWPNSKGLGGQDENDIMMLRPTSTSENSSRGNTAYGPNYYDPNSESGGTHNLHGDVARICLYVYVRWGNTSYMWGEPGVMESLDVLLDWMEEDPVDTWELGRNDAVEAITGTRNVFVDYPELGFLLFDADIPADYDSPSGEGAGTAYAITASSNNTSYGTVSLSGRTITAIPKTGYYAAGYTVLSGTATVTQEGNIFRVQAETDCSVRINFAARQQFTVTYSENGQTTNTASVYGGDTVSLPTATAPDGYLFLGWVTSPVSEVTVKPAVLAPSSTQTITGATTYYALYSHVVDDGSGGGVVETTFEFGDDLQTGSHGDGKEVTSTYSETSGDYTLTLTDLAVFYAQANDAAGNSALKIGSGSNVGGFTFTVPAEVSKVIIQVAGYKDKTVNISVNGTAQTITTLSNNGEYTAVEVDTTESKTVTFTTTGSSGRCMIDSITYVVAGGGSTYYITTTCDHSGGATAADGQDATCTENGYTAGMTCNDCGAFVSGHEVIEATGHSYNAVVTNPTATEQGYTTYTCTVCGDNYKDNYTDALGYTYTVTFAVPSGVTAPSSMESNTKTGITLPTAGVPTGDYTYEFLGWVTDEYDNVTEKPDDALILEADSTYTAPSDITLYALYTYSVGGSGGGAGGTGELSIFGTTGTKSSTTVIYWEGNNIRFTNDKANSSTAIRTSDSDHYRVYASSTVTIATVDGSSMSKIVVTCTGSSYATALVTSATNAGLTASASGSVVTITPAAGVASVTLTASAQIRLSAVSVTYGGGSSGDAETYYTTMTCDHSGGTTNVPAKDATCTEAGYTAGVQCNECESFISGHEEVAALGHNYTGVVTDPTATEQGYTTYTCSRCGDSYKDNYVPALGNSYTVSFRVPEGVAAIADMVSHTSTGITLPTAGVPTGDYTYSFIGWVEEDVDNLTAAPTYLAGGSTYTAKKDVTLIALYTYAVGGSGSTDYIQTEPADINSTDTVVITVTLSDGTVYALSSSNGTGAAPSAVAVTLNGNKLAAEPAEALKWNISGTADSFTIYPKGTTATWLYCNSSNNGVRVGTGANNAFTVDGSTGYLKNIGQNRYLGVYTTTPDWRCYTGTTGNIAGQTLAFYVQGSAGTTYYTTVISAAGDLPENTISVSFSVPAGVSGMASLHGNGTFTLPNISANGQTITVGETVYTFMGWVVSKVDNKTAKPSKIYAVGETYTATEDTVLRALYTYNVITYEEVSGGSTGGSEVTFTMGDDNGTQHADGSELSSGATLTSGDYTLTLDTVSKVYGKNSYDGTGRSTLKLGTGSALGKFSFTVPEEVTSVTFMVAGYKTNNAKISVNGGATQTISTYSNDGAYTAVTVDTTTNKTVTFTTVSGGYRCMIDEIIWTVGGTAGGTTTEEVITPYYTTEIGGLDVAQLVGANLVLGDLLHLNFYADVSEQYRNADLTVRFTYVGRNGEVVVTDTYSSREFVIDYNGYTFTVSAVASYMAVSIKAELLYGEEIKDTVTYSIRSYAATIIANESGVYTDAQIAAAKAMLNYGAWAQNYFGYNTGDLANSVLDAGDRLTDTATALDAAKAYFNTNDLSAYKATVTNKLDSFIGYTLLLKDVTGIRLYFREQVTVTVTDAEGNETVLTAEVDPQDDTRYFVEIEGVNAADLDSPNTITCGEMEISNLSVLSLAATVAQNTGKSENFRNAMIALMLYAQSVNTMLAEG